ncbi:MAG TPA: tRNA (adenosine(37)-N6)-threonylcarbamoyltransferase complex ATPase subunit type 1 TsaE [Candidatus Limnocylindria bacterium]|nr:tRNA (adenosine(37)-N6)-threonylcarbamoyltransferase complex ATPase subunit type 1 TsaE [Candidatus Limnocylindria bacterium]
MGGWTIVTTSPRQSQNLGRILGKLVQGGEIVGLVGEFGAGKTCFVRGFARGIDVAADAWVRSPTFTLINEYSGRLPVYHIDLYRVGKQEELDSLNLREYLYGDGVSLIEWFEFLPSHEVDEHLELRISHGGGDRRELTFIAHGQRYERLLEQLKSKALKRSKRQKINDKKET